MDELAKVLWEANARATRGDGTVSRLSWEQATFDQPHYWKLAAAVRVLLISDEVVERVAQAIVRSDAVAVENETEPATIAWGDILARAALTAAVGDGK